MASPPKSGRTYDCSHCFIHRYFPSIKVKCCSRAGAQKSISKGASLKAPTKMAQPGVGEDVAALVLLNCWQLAHKCCGLRLNLG